MGVDSKTPMPATKWQSAGLLAMVRRRWPLIGALVAVILLSGGVGWQLTHHHSHKPAAKPVTQTAVQTPVLRSALVATGLQAPVGIVPAPGTSTLYVVEEAGTIRTLAPDGTVGATPFMDIRDKVLYSVEMGLLGLAFSPNYPQDGYIYIDYVNKSQYTVVARYHVATSGTVDPASEKVLLTVKQPYPNHKAGDLMFGPDGYLYITLGDGGSGGDPQNHAQNKNDYLGKLLRIDVSKGNPYTVPATNPFAHDTNAKPEVWAYGLRNPWRISFDRATGDLYIADVGQNAVEEIDVQKAGDKGGENYGWRCYEASRSYNLDGCGPTNNYTMPVLEYDHSGGRCSITGGYVYRGSRYPGLTGKYIYSDYCSGELFYMSKQAGKEVATLAAKTPYAISSFGQDNSGELYFADLTTGSVYHLEDSAN